MKIRAFCDFGIFGLINCLFVIFFYSLFNISKETFEYSFYHSIMASILITQLSRNLKKKKKISLGFLLLYVITMYFQFSTIKYCRVDVFYGFTKDNSIRMQGTIIVFLVMFFMNVFVSNSNSTLKKNNLHFKLQIRRKPTENQICMAYITSFVLIIYYFFVRNYSNSIYTSLTYKAESIYTTMFVNIIVCMGIYFAIIIWDAKNIFLIVPLVMDFICFTYGSMKSGSRAAFFSYSLLIVFMLVDTKAIRVKYFAIVQIIAPWFMIVFTYFSFKISGRYTNDMLNVVAKNIAYRFDLSDLAINLMNNTSWWRYDFEEIIAGFQNCIPSIISTRYKGFDAYKNMLATAELIPTVDYSDTFFSMGASVGGVVGMLLIIPVLYILYEKIDICLMKKGKIGTYIKMLSVLCFVRIETEWITFICAIRTLLIEIIAILGIYYFVNCIKKFS